MPNAPASKENRCLTSSSATSSWWCLILLCLNFSSADVAWSTLSIPTAKHNTRLTYTATYIGWLSPSSQLFVPQLRSKWFISRTDYELFSFYFDATLYLFSHICPSKIFALFLHSPGIKMSLFKTVNSYFNDWWWRKWCLWALEGRV